MRKFIAFTLVLIMSAASFGALTYDGDYYLSHMYGQYTQSRSTNPIYLSLVEIEEDIAAVVAGAGDLDAQYNGGSAIDVDTDAITLTVSDTDNNVALAIVQNEATNDNEALTITMGTGATGTAILINSVALGTDIAGDNWSVTQAGLITGVGFTCSGEFQTTADVLLNGTYDVAWDVNRNQLLFQDSAICGFGGAHDAAADITLTYDGAGDDLDIVFDDKEIAFGADGAGGDVIFHLETASTYIMVDEDADELLLVLADLKISQGSQIEFIDVTDGLTDWTIDNATDETLLITPTETTDDQSVNLGNATNTTDLRIFGKTASTVVFDASGDEVLFDAYDISLGDGDYLLFGDALGTGDFSISDQTDVLTIAQVVADTGTIAIGADGAGIDTKFFGEEAGAYMLWDATSADQLKLVGANSSGTLLNITGIDTTGNSDTITIAHSGTGAALQITSSEADTQLVELISAANQTTWLQVIDGAAGNWIGADDVGMLTLKGDTAGTHAGTSLLNIQNTAQPVASAEGFLARFVSTGTATTDAYAVEIEVPATQPAFAANGIVTITGQDAAGAALVQISNTGTTGNADAMTIASNGSGDGLQITCGDADSVALNAVAAASQTASAVVVDGTTGSWIGAATTGMVHLTSDGALVADGSLLRIASTGNISAANDGALLELVESGTEQATSYTMRIASTNNEALHVDSGKVLIDESLIATLGIQVGVGETLTANSAEGAAQTIDGGVTVANVTAVNAGVNDFITLPNDPTIGTVVKVMCNAGSNFEIRTLEAGNDKINNVDCSDGGTEYLATDTDMIIFTCVNADNWQAVSYPLAGGARAAVTPD